MGIIFSHMSLATCVDKDVTIPLQVTEGGGSSATQLRLNPP